MELDGRPDLGRPPRLGGRKTRGAGLARKSARPGIFGVIQFIRLYGTLRFKHDLDRPLVLKLDPKSLRGLFQGE